MPLNLEMRAKTLVNIDGKRRCYNGCYAGWEWQYSDWAVLEYEVPLDKVESRLEFWKDLNEYAVSQRGESARREYRTVETKGEVS